MAPANPLPIFPSDKPDSEQALAGDVAAVARVTGNT